MLDAETRLSLQQKYYPYLREHTFGPIQAALETYLGDSMVLDAGCGAGTWILRASGLGARSVVGTDICLPEKLPTNPFVLADLSHIPFAADIFDLVVCYNVIEHLQQPSRVFTEFARVLKVGGALIFKTPSLYAPLIMLSRLTPHWLHQGLKRSLIGAAKPDVFPTYYRCNTPDTLERCLRSAGFRREQLLMVDQTYEYLSFSRLAYALGLLYSRMIQAGFLRVFGTGIAGIYVKATTV